MEENNEADGMQFAMDLGSTALARQFLRSSKDPDALRQRFLQDEHSTNLEVGTEVVLQHRCFDERPLLASSSCEWLWVSSDGKMRATWGVGDEDFLIIQDGQNFYGICTEVQEPADQQSDNTDKAFYVRFPDCHEKKLHITLQSNERRLCVRDEETQLTEDLEKTHTLEFDSSWALVRLWPSETMFPGEEKKMEKQLVGKVFPALVSSGNALIRNEGFHEDWMSFETSEFSIVPIGIIAKKLECSAGPKRRFLVYASESLGSCECDEDELEPFDRFRELRQA